MSAHNTLGILRRRFKLNPEQPDSISRPGVVINGTITDEIPEATGILVEQMNANTAAVRELQEIVTEIADKLEVRGVVAHVKSAR